ncbi:hypothetical protein LOK49_LG02G03305 [Camellia lanceoleosa]|uniref:Uncharacterized protein n=1 Tax=Camellia lanceoleosa TaxID=1840588 RepID=A0ACC0IQU3_9ERIC|nr:hypothetical protein LOK49_LG02G03305 [Camellia lanceoleosa]
MEFMSVAFHNHSGAYVNPVPVAVSIGGWMALSPGCFKANCDVAMSPNSTSAAIAVLFRKWKGELVDGVVQRLKVYSTLQGEVFAICKACLMAKTLNLSHVEIEGDNKSVISLCVFEDTPLWACAPLIANIRALARGSNLSFH